MHQSKKYSAQNVLNEAFGRLEMGNYERGAGGARG